jgi:hypothetical protein
MGANGDSLIKVTRERSSLLASYTLRAFSCEWGETWYRDCRRITEYTARKIFLGPGLDKVGNWKRGGEGLAGLLRFSPLGK